MFFAFHDNPEKSSSGFKFSSQKLANNDWYQKYQTVFDDYKSIHSNESRTYIDSLAAARHWKYSGKLQVLIKFLKDWKKKDPKTKVLIFSQTKKILDILERLSEQHDFSHLRMDGDVSLKQRMDLIDTFNKTDEHYLFLLTTRVGGLGINLTAANKVIIFDPDWNPMIDIQATDRALRIGQKRDVEIYRFVVEDSLEEKIYHR